MKVNKKQLNNLQNFILLIFLLILANFLFWSFVFGQGNGVNIGAVVPVNETSKNINKETEIKSEEPQQKENKYLFYFQKSLEEQKNPDIIETQTIYDRIASWGLMVGVMVVAGILLVMLLRLGESVIRKLAKSLKFFH